MSIAEKLIAIAENQEAVYNAGYEKGASEGGGATDTRFKEIVEGTITEINDSEITNIRSFCFSSCSKLVNVSFPNVTNIGQKAFDGCSSLKSVNVQKVESLPNSAFSACPQLTHIDMPSVKKISGYAFFNCKKLDTLVLRTADVICTLESTSAFNSTPFASGGTGGTAYVPQALIEQYQNATNWSTLYAAGTCNFVAIEGSEYE